MNERLTIFIKLYFYRLVWHNIRSSRHLSRRDLPLQNYHPWKLSWWRLPGKAQNLYSMLRRRSVFLSFDLITLLYKLLTLFCFSSEGFLWSSCFSSSDWATSTVRIGCSSRPAEEMASKRQSYLANITLHKESFLQNRYKWTSKPRSCRPVSYKYMAR